MQLQLRSGQRIKIDAGQCNQLITHHPQHISLGVIKADACAIRGETDKRKAELVNHMGAMGARM